MYLLDCYEFCEFYYFCCCIRHVGEKAQLVVITNAGHAINVEKPNELCKNLKSFLIDPSKQENHSNGLKVDPQKQKNFSALWICMFLDYFMQQL